jgi:hypothetical protein
MDNQADHTLSINQYHWPQPLSVLDVDPWDPMYGDYEFIGEVANLYIDPAGINRMVRWYGEMYEPNEQLSPNAITYSGFGSGYNADPALMRNKDHTSVTALSIEEIWQQRWFYDPIYKSDSRWRPPVFLQCKDIKFEDYVKAVLDHFKGRVIDHYCDLTTGRLMVIAKDAVLWRWGDTYPNTLCFETSEAEEAFCNSMGDYLKIADPDKKTTKVTELLHGPQGLQKNTISVDHDEVQQIYPSLYPTIDIKELWRDFKASPETILILFGEPGVGKTCFMKYCMLESSGKKCYYVKDEKVLHDAGFWSMLCEERPELVILDDLDNILQPRQEGDTDNPLGKMLSTTDGIFPMTTKFIISTNQGIQSIDPAIVRPGRCFDFLELPPLTLEEAKQFWRFKKLKLSDFEEAFGELTQVTQAAIMSQIYRIERGNRKRKYNKKTGAVYSVESKLEQHGISYGRPKIGLNR